ncbi:MAG: hypothetical protein CL489_02890 [Acidobacteria bacterium]|nr:hypothetical protein [Acidobacteriota bacterium]
MSTKTSDYFQHLLKRDHSDLLDQESEEPDYPGSTPPRNRADSPIPKSRFDDVMVDAKAKYYKVHGELREFFPIGELARLLHRKAVTIRMWERNGWIPHANYRTPAPKGEQIPGVAPKGRRLYSREQVEFLLTAVGMFNLDNQREADWSGFKTHTSANWPV